MKRILAAILAVLLVSGVAFGMSDFLKKRLIFGFYGTPVVVVPGDPGDIVLWDGTDAVLWDASGDKVLWQ